MTISDVKRFISQKTIVEYKGVRYYVEGYELKYNGEWLHDLILHDLNANSVMVAPLDEVAEVRNEA